MQDADVPKYVRPLVKIISLTAANLNRDGTKKKKKIN